MKKCTRLIITATLGYGLLLGLGSRSYATPTEEDPLQEAIRYAEFRAQVATQMADNAQANVAALQKIYSSTKTVAWSSTTLAAAGLTLAIIPAATGNYAIGTIGRSLAAISGRALARLGRHHPILTLVGELALTGVQHFGGKAIAIVPTAGLIAMPIVILSEAWVGKSIPTLETPHAPGIYDPKATPPRMREREEQKPDKADARVSVVSNRIYIIPEEMPKQLQTIAQKFGDAHVQISRHLDDVLNSIPDSSFPLGWPDYNYAQAMVSAEKTQQNLWEAERDYMTQAAFKLRRFWTRIDEELRKVQTVK